MSQLIKRNSKYQHQAGITLIEVLITLLLMAIIGLGGAYVAARTAVVYTVAVYTVVHSVVGSSDLYAFRSPLQTHNFLGLQSNRRWNINITINGTSVTTPCTLTSTTYTVNSYQASSPTSIYQSQSVTVNSPAIQVSSSDTFVPVKSVISP